MRAKQLLPSLPGVSIPWGMQRPGKTQTVQVITAGETGTGVLNLPVILSCRIPTESTWLFLFWGSWGGGGIQFPSTWNWERQLLRT